MRKVLFLLFFFTSLSINAQIFNSKRVLDKFDDVVSDKFQKTLIQKTDSTFIIEEKGKDPEVFEILNFTEVNSAGSKDSIVNLVKNVYGYQECWCIIHIEDSYDYAKAYIDAFNAHGREESHKIINDMVEKYCYYITHRVVTTQYSHTFESEYYWIQKGDNNGRTVYYNTNDY